MDILRLQQGTHSFVDFSLDMMGKNNLLASTDSFLNDELLQDMLKADMDCNLARECHQENLTSIISLRDWLNEVKRLDECKQQRMEEIEHTLARINVRSNTSHSTLPCTPFANANTNSAAGPNVFTPIHKLLDAERQLLSANSGCYKCCKSWAGHVGA